MRQVLFTVPGLNLPVFGFGMMLLIAFLACTWFGSWRAKKEGMSPDFVWDLAIWVFVGGIIGARVLSLVVDPIQSDNVWDWIVQFVQIWKGGLIFYGSVAGGALAYAIFHWRVVRKKNISFWRVADFAAPCIALGIFLGRIGCFLNGCCWGDPADPAAVPAWQTVRFPPHSPPHSKVVSEGHQLAYGFTVSGTMVDFVDAGSDAYAQGLRAGDGIIQVGEQRLAAEAFPDEIKRREMELDRMEPRRGGNAERAQQYVLGSVLAHHLAAWPGNQPLKLVRRSAEGFESPITFHMPRSLPLHPTQLYSSFDGLLAFLLLAAYYPFRRRPGEVMALYMMLYAANRFLIEKLRSDNPPAEFTGMTLSQNISVAVFLFGLGLWVWLRHRKQARTGDMPPGR